MKIALAHHCALAAALLDVPLAAQPKPTYQVYAIRYATIPDFAASQLVPAS